MRASTKRKAAGITKAELKAEVSAWAALMKVCPVETHVRRMTRKWGSCSTSGRVTLADALRAEQPGLRKEVIVHELLHLKVPNHGKLFKALLRAYLAKTLPHGCPSP